VVTGLVTQEHVSIVCLQETKLNVIDDWMVANTIGYAFVYVFVPTLSTCGGILVACRSDHLLASNIWQLPHTLTIRLSTMSG
jgi:hypothetical protein